MRFRIPPGAHRSIAQPEGARKVDDTDPSVDQRRRQVSGGLVGEGEEDHVGVLRQRGRIERRDVALEQVSEGGQLARRRGA